MKKYYIRKLDKQAVNKQISILKETKKSFFENQETVTIIGKKSNKKSTVTILTATDPRLGGGIKDLIKEEGGCEEGNFLIISKNKNKYELEIVDSDASEANYIKKLFGDDERHLEIICEFDNEEHSSIIENLIGYNKIYYGIPGCGKSYHIEHDVLSDADKEDVFRTTFYLDYSNSDFIGQIYPVVKDGNVTYEPIPGPFTKALERALTNKDHMVYLVIEEINRGNAAAIFGDVFQLLDRLKEDDTVNGRLAGSSEYPISNTFIEGYLEQQGVDFIKGQIVIPNNLTILATMNTSDQNVFPLDTAFKRRWDRERVSTDWKSDIDIKEWHVPCTDITWENFARTINDAILETDSNSDVSISEDKQMGAYFAQKNMLTEGDNKDGEALISFTNNVIDYLYNDVTKFNHSLLFEKGINSFNDLYNRVIDYTKTPVNSTEPNVGPHAVLYKLFNEDIVKKLEDNVKKDKDAVKTNTEANGNEDEGTED